MSWLLHPIFNDKKRKRKDYGTCVVVATSLTWPVEELYGSGDIYNIYISLLFSFIYRLLCTYIFPRQLKKKKKKKRISACVLLQKVVRTIAAAATGQTCEASLGWMGGTFSFSLHRLFVGKEARLFDWHDLLDVDDR